MIFNQVLKAQGQQKNILRMNVFTTNYWEVKRHADNCSNNIRTKIRTCKQRSKHIFSKPIFSSNRQILQNSTRNYDPNRFFLLKLLCCSAVVARLKNSEHIFFSKQAK